jgi:hypothetical protein
MGGAVPLKPLLKPNSGAAGRAAAMVSASAPGSPAGSTGAAPKPVAATAPPGGGWSKPACSGIY